MEAQGIPKEKDHQTFAQSLNEYVISGTNTNGWYTTSNTTNWIEF